jgi:hypothetical protein
MLHNITPLRAVNSTASSCQRTSQAELEDTLTGANGDEGLYTQIAFARREQSTNLHNIGRAE